MFRRQGVIFSTYARKNIEQAGMKANISFCAAFPI